MPSRKTCRIGYGWRYRLVIAMGFVLISGCATAPPVSTLPLREATAFQLLKGLGEREAAIHTLKGLFRANLAGESLPVSLRLDGAFYYRRPHTVRLKGFTRFGGVVFDFKLHGDHYKLAVPGEGQRISGNLQDMSDRQGLAVPIRLSLRAIEAMLGKVIKDHERQTAFVEDGDLYRFDIVPLLPPASSEGVAVQRIWVDRRTFLVNRMEYLSADGIPTMIVQGKNFRRVTDASPYESSTIMLPFHIEAEDRVAGGTVSLEFQELVANVPLAPQMFELARFDSGQANPEDEGKRPRTP